MVRARSPAPPSRASGLHFCIDNTAVVRGLLGHLSDNSQHDFLSFYETVARIDPPSLYIQWAPGHTDVIGSEAADAQAKLGAAQLPDDLPTNTTTAMAMTLTHLRRTMREERKLPFSRWWLHNTPTPSRIHDRASRAIGQS